MFLKYKYVKTKIGLLHLCLYPELKIRTLPFHFQVYVIVLIKSCLGCRRRSDRLRAVVFEKVAALTLIDDVDRGF